LPDHQERQPHLLAAQLSATLRRRLITSCRSSGGAIGDGAAVASAAVIGDGAAAASAAAIGDGAAAASAAAIGDGAAAGGSEPAKLTATRRRAGRRKRPAVDFAQRTSVTCSTSRCAPAAQPRWRDYELDPDRARTGPIGAVPPALKQRPPRQAGKHARTRSDPCAPLLSQCECLPRKVGAEGQKPRSPTWCGGMGEPGFTRGPGEIARTRQPSKVTRVPSYPGKRLIARRRRGAFRS
jgi:hypothetical protein